MFGAFAEGSESFDPPPRTCVWTSDRAARLRKVAASGGSQPGRTEPARAGQQGQSRPGQASQDRARWAARQPGSQAARALAPGSFAVATS